MNGRVLLNLNCFEQGRSGIKIMTIVLKTSAASMADKSEPLKQHMLIFLLKDLLFKDR